MKKLVLAIFIIIITISLQAENIEKPWTIVKANAIGKYEKARVGYFWAGPSLEVKLGKVKPGTKVYPIEHRESVYHIRFEDGQIGWVFFTMLKETQELYVKKDIKLHQVKGTTSFRMGAFIDSLKQGDLVTRLGLIEGGGAYIVKTKKGQKGAIIRQYAYPNTENTLKEYSTKKAKVFHLRKNIDAKVLNKSSANLTAEFGMPEALVHNKTGDVWYYTYLETHYDGLRYRGMTFIVKDDIVISNNLLGEGDSKLLDKLPLFIKMKGISSLDVFDKSGPGKWSKRISRQHWAVRTLIFILKLILLYIVLSFAHYLAFFITMVIARIKLVNNGILILFGASLSIALNYLYFIFIAAHVIKEEVWFPLIVMTFILVTSLRKITNRISYHRCPQCRTMYSAEDRGSILQGKKHITEHKSEKRVTSEYTQSDGRKVREITNFKWQEHMTEKQIKDQRYCQKCGFRWSVDRVEKVNGHV